MNALKTFLNPLNASRSDREAGAAFIKQHPHHFKELFEAALNAKGKRFHVMCAWILEKVLLDELDKLKPKLDAFLSALPKIQNESMRRPLSKILYHFLKVKENRKSLREEQCNQIIAICFDWIIGPAKVATFSFALKVIGLFKKQRPEVRTLLNDALHNGFEAASPGMLVAIRRVLKD